MLSITEVIYADLVTASIFSGCTCGETDSAHK